jgi:hypothetical protein
MRTVLSKGFFVGLGVVAYVGGCCCLPTGPLTDPKAEDLVGKYVGELKVSDASKAPPSGASRLGPGGVSDASGDILGPLEKETYAPPGPQTVELKANGTCVVENLYLGASPPRFFTGEGTWRLQCNTEGVWYVKMSFGGAVKGDLQVRGCFRPYKLIDQFLGPDIPEGFVYSRQEE